MRLTRSNEAGSLEEDGVASAQGYRRRTKSTATGRGEDANKLRRRGPGWFWPCWRWWSACRSWPGAESGLFPLAPIRRQRVPCDQQDPIYRIAKEQYFGYHPTCWRRFPDGWGCPSPERPDREKSFRRHRWIPARNALPEAQCSRRARLRCAAGTGPPMPELAGARTFSVRYT